MEHIITLLIGMAILGLPTWVFWPERGLIAKWRKARLNSERVLIEDALKYLYDCEYKGIKCGVQSVAGRLNISADHATEIIVNLEHLHLVTREDAYLHLTESGTAYALKIIRIHRIWERYLADHTGVHETSWHKEADFKEHFMSIEEANTLAASIGNPVFDPHGDPIPTEKGEIPNLSGQSMVNFKVGDHLLIEHIEDEPPAIYAQLVAMGLFPGMEIHILSVDESKIRFYANGEEHVLAPAFATNLTLRPLEKEIIHTEYRKLNSLAIGDTAQVKGISPACRGLERRRLMDLGVIPGTKITALLKSPGGDPISYDILGAQIALRKEQAAMIYITSLGTP